MSTSYLDKDGLQDYTTKLVAKLKTILATKSDIGTPLMAATAAAMTDTTKIYVYTGSETGYITGHWYYYNGSTWTDGGMYNSPTDIDPTLTIQGYAADAKAVGDIKADKDGYYEDLSVGRADNIISDVAVTEKMPYSFRGTGGNIEVGDTMKLKALCGATVRLYQRDTLQSSSASSVNGWIRANSTYSGLTLSGRTYTLASKSNTSTTKNVRTTNNWITDGHVYFVCADIEVSDSSTYAYLSMGTNANGGSLINFIPAFQGPTNGFVHKAAIKRASYSGSTISKFFMRINNGAPNESYAKFRELQVINLTLAVGPEVADYILQREEAEAGAGVALFRQIFPYKYYTGSTSMTARSMTTDKKICVGFNAYNPATTKAKVIPNEEYTIEGNYTSYTYTPLGSTVTTTTLASDTGASSPTFAFAGELTFTGADSDLCVHLKYDGTREGEKASYRAREYEFEDNVNLKGFLKLDANNNIYLNGDTYAPDGTVTRYVGYTTLGEESWNYDSTNEVFYASISNLKLGGDVIFTQTYKHHTGTIATMPNNSYWNEENEYSATNFVVKTSSYSNVTDFVSGLSTQAIYYELDTPTTESAAAYIETQLIDNWGTEEFVDYAFSHGNNIVCTPYGHISDYLQDLKAKVETTPNLPSIDGTYLLRRQNGVYTYAPVVLNNFQISATTQFGEDPPTYLTDKTFEEIIAAYTEGKRLQFKITMNDVVGIAELCGVMMDSTEETYLAFKFSYIDATDNTTYAATIETDMGGTNAYALISYWSN